jgi:SAM-dependent methyltransferase
MLIQTIDLIKCTGNHSGERKLVPTIEISKETAKGTDIIRGQLTCPECDKEYAIIQGVLILVHNSFDYFNQYILGISTSVTSDDIPQNFKKHYTVAVENKKYNQQIRPEKWQVNSWYILNNFFSAKDLLNLLQIEGAFYPNYFKNLINEIWDKGPLYQLSSLFKSDAHFETCIDVGCNVGGAIRVMHNRCRKSIGVDISFSSVYIARALFYESKNFSYKFLADSLFVGKDVKFEPNIDETKFVDFFVCDLRNMPLASKKFDVVVSMNVMDMIDNPIDLLNNCKNLLTKTGIIYFSCPYTWNEKAVSKLRSIIPPSVKNSASAIEWLFLTTGFTIEDVKYDMPWLFLKHNRQLVLYSLHSFFARQIN